MHTKSRLLVLVGLLATLDRIAVAGVPTEFTIQGILRDGQGRLQTMAVDVTVGLYDAPMAGRLLAGPYGPRQVAARNGLFTIGVDEPDLKPLLAGANEVWVELIAGNEIFSRQRVTSEIYAQMARSADLADRLSAVCVGCVKDGMVDSMAAAKVIGKVSAAGTADLALSVMNGVSTTGQYADPAWLLSLAGTKVTGTLTNAQIPGTNVSGSVPLADVVRNGLYSTGNYADPSWLTALDGAKVSGSLTRAQIPGANVSGAVSSALSSIVFSGMLGGDVVGTQGLTRVQGLGGSPLGNLGGAKAGDQLGFNGMSWTPVTSYSDTDALLAVSMAGYLKQGDKIGAGQLPADGIDEVSNNLLTTTFNTTFTSTDTPVANNPLDGLAQSRITATDVGVITEIQVSVNITDPDIGAFKVELIAPDASKVVLYDRGSPGVANLVRSWDQTSVLPQGSLAAYIGKHPTGLWELKITNSVVGNNETLQSWSLSFMTLSGARLQVRGSLQVTGDLETASLNGSPLGNLGAAIAGQVIGFDGAKWAPTSATSSNFISSSGFSCSPQGAGTRTSTVATTPIPPGTRYAVISGSGVGNSNGGTNGNIDFGGLSIDANIGSLALRDWSQTGASNTCFQCNVTWNSIAGNITVFFTQLNPAQNSGGAAGGGTIYFYR